MGKLVPDWILAGIFKSEISADVNDLDTFFKQRHNRLSARLMGHCRESNVYLIKVSSNRQIDIRKVRKDISQSLPNSAPAGNRGKRYRGMSIEQPGQLETGIASYVDYTCF